MPWASGDVVLLRSANVSSVMAIAGGSGIFGVVGYTPNGDRMPLLDELAPYTGIAPVNAEITAFAVHSSGVWSLQISTK